MNRISRFPKSLGLFGVLCVIFLTGPKLTGQQIKLHATLVGHTAAVGPIAFSPSGKILASGSLDGTVKLWDLSEPAHPKALTIEIENPAPISSLSFSPDGKKLVLGTKDRITVMDVQTRKKDNQIEFGKSGASPYVAFSPDGKLLAWSHNNKITFWDIATATAIKEFDTAQKMLGWIAFSPDGKKLASANRSQINIGNIKLWDVPSGDLLGTIPNPHKFGVSRVLFAPNGKTLVSTGLDATGSKKANNPPPPPPNSEWHGGDIKLWDVATLKEIRSWRAHNQTFSAIAISGDGKYLASGGMENLVKLWDYSSGQGIATLEGHTERVSSAAFSPDGMLLATGSADKTIKLWDLRPIKGK